MKQEVLAAARAHIAAGENAETAVALACAGVTVEGMKQFAHLRGSGPALQAWQLAQRGGKAVQRSWGQAFRSVSDPLGRTRGH